MLSLKIGVLPALTTHMLMFVLGLSVYLLRPSSRQGEETFEVGEVFMSLDRYLLEWNDDKAPPEKSVILGWLGQGCRLHSEPVKVKLTKTRFLVSGPGKSLLYLRKAAKMQKSNANLKMAILPNLPEPGNIKKKEALRAKQGNGELKICSGFERRARDAR